MAESFGPWTQGDDYQTTAITPLAWVDTNVRQGATASESTAPGEFDIDVHQAVVNNSGILAWAPSDPGSIGLLNTSFFSGLLGNSYSATQASVVEGFHTYHARRALPNLFEQMVAAGAVSWQWETPTAETVAIEIPAPQFRSADNMVGPWSTMVYAIRPGDHLEVGADPLATRPDPVGLRWDAGEAFREGILSDNAGGEETLDPSILAKLGGVFSEPFSTVTAFPPIDLTSHMFGPEAAVVYARKVRLFGYPGIGVHQGGGQYFATGGAELENWAPVVTLRPPRHRWVYERAPLEPPTRMFPRDDGLATSSGSRVWPPPRSRQGSPRIGPGSYY